MNDLRLRHFQSCIKFDLINFNFLITHKNIKELFRSKFTNTFEWIQFELTSLENLKHHSQVLQVVSSLSFTSLWHHQRKILIIGKSLKIFFLTLWYLLLALFKSKGISLDIECPKFFILWCQATLVLAGWTIHKRNYLIICVSINYGMEIFTLRPHIIRIPKVNTNSNLPILFYHRMILEIHMWYLTSKINWDSLSLTTSF